MMSLLALIDDLEMKKEERTEHTKEKARLEKLASLELRDTSMKGRINTRNLTDVSIALGASIHEKQGQQLFK